LQTTTDPAQQELGLRVGELVEVCSQAEILATPDERGELESLPFRPETLQFCDRRFRVAKLALKLCDTIAWSGMHRMRNAVHLGETHCDGQVYGDCQAGCTSAGKGGLAAPGPGRYAGTDGHAALHASDAVGGDAPDC
jgi:hypothetical protein